MKFYNEALHKVKFYIGTLHKMNERLLLDSIGSFPVTSNIRSNLRDQIIKENETIHLT
jgi:hypothetical protein